MARPGTPSPSIQYTPANPAAAGSCRGRPGPAGDRSARTAAHGARLDWPRFARYGVQSATLARAYLSAVAAMHRTARDGHPITRTIAAPILNADGKPIRRKGGAIVRSAVAASPPTTDAREVPPTKAAGHLESTRRAVADVGHQGRCIHEPVPKPPAPRRS